MEEIIAKLDDICVGLDRVNEANLVAKLDRKEESMNNVELIQILERSFELNEQIYYQLSTITERLEAIEEKLNQKK